MQHTTLSHEWGLRRKQEDEHGGSMAVPPSSDDVPLPF